MVSREDEDEKLICEGKYVLIQRGDQERITEFKAQE
jgi:hypothetical protein